MPTEAAFEAKDREGDKRHQIAEGTGDLNELPQGRCTPYPARMRLAFWGLFSLVASQSCRLA
jgi:hypothetical protein